MGLDAANSQRAAVVGIGDRRCIRVDGTTRQVAAPAFRSSTPRAATSAVASASAILAHGIPAAATTTLTAVPTAP